MRLTAWTVLLSAILLMPIARVALPALDLPIGPAITHEEPTRFLGPRAAPILTVTTDAAEPAWPLLLSGYGRGSRASSCYASALASG